VVAPGREKALIQWCRGGYVPYHQVLGLIRAKGYCVLRRRPRPGSRDFAGKL
jgi:hypothetical protein